MRISMGLFVCDVVNGASGESNHTSQQNADREIVSTCVIKILVFLWKTLNKTMVRLTFCHLNSTIYIRQSNSWIARSRLVLILSWFLALNCIIWMQIAGLNAKMSIFWQLWQDILNHCFEDLEKFMTRLQQAAEARFVLNQRNKKGGRKSKKENQDGENLKKKS